MNSIHGLYGSPVHKSWAAMVARCCNPNNEAFARYGGAGIKVCGRLRSSAVGLFELLGPRPEGMSIDRIESTGNYACGACEECLKNGWSKNVRWATRQQQSRNQRGNKYLTINGTTKLLCEWALIAGVHSSVILKRIKNGWPDNELAAPADPKYHHKASAKPPGE